VKKMKLWLLRRTSTSARHDYDEADGFVVRARSEAEAREFAASKCGSEGRKSWLGREDGRHATSCVELQADGRAEVVLRDFCAG